MSGAASIAAAKNRRTKPDPNQKPIISCSTAKNGACPLPSPGSKLAVKTPTVNSVFDEESLQIKGPMHLMYVLKVHEERLNKIDSKLGQQLSPMQAYAPQACAPQTCVSTDAQAQEGQACDAECYDRISVLEEKVQMLEEVIMNLQLTLTNVQSFAMESNLAMMKLQNQMQTVTAPVPVPAPVSAPAPVSVPAVPSSPTLLEVTD
jgi:uncharacterized coiled-coil protein SlyX